jgi:Tol biopolymer transport system component
MIPLIPVSVLFRCRLLLVGTGFLLNAFLSAQPEVRLVTGDATGSGFDADMRVLDTTADGGEVLFLGEPSRRGPSPGLTRAGFYLRHLGTDTISLVLDEGESLEGAISGDGRILVYAKGDNIWRFDRLGTNPQVISGNPNDDTRSPQISDDGRYIAYASIATDSDVENPGAIPEGGLPYVVLYDAETKTRRIVTTAPDGSALESGFGGVNWFDEFSLSGNGRYLFYSTDAGNAHPERSNVSNEDYFWLYRRDLETGEIMVAGKNETGEVPPGNMTTPSASGNGQRILFTGAFIGGNGLVSGYLNPFGTDLFWKDLESGQVVRITQTEDGGVPDGFLSGSSLSPDGLLAAFASTSTNLLVPDDENFFDIYSVAIFPGESRIEMGLVSEGPDPSLNVDFSSGPIAADTYVLFNTRQWAEMLGEPDANDASIHGIAVGTFPAPPPDQGARISILEDETVGFMPLALSADGTRALIIEREAGFQLWEVGIGLTDVPGTEGVNRSTMTSHTNSDLTAMIGRRFASGGQEDVYYSEATGAVVMPPAPNQGDASLDLHAVLDDGRVLVQYRARNPETDEFQAYTFLWSPDGNWTDLTDLYSGAAIGVASPGGAVGEPVRGSWEDPRDRLFRWTPEGGYEELSLPGGREVGGIPFGLNEAGTVFFVRLSDTETFQSSLFRWKEDSGFTEVNNSEVFDGFSYAATTGNGALAALEKTFWKASGGSRVLKDELLALGADPAVFAGGDIDRIADVEVVGEDTLVFGSFRTFDFQNSHFVAALPYVPSDGRQWGPYPMDAEGYVNTGDWFGYLWVDGDSGLVWSYDINEWLFLPAGNITPQGAWAFISRPPPPAPATGANGSWLEFPLDGGNYADTGDWMGYIWQSTAQPGIIWNYAMSTFLYLPESSVGPSGGWGYLFR